MHIDHKAGEKLFVDYAGDKLAIVDPDSGKEQPVETFVAILAASELTYVEASATQRGEDWIDPRKRPLTSDLGSGFDIEKLGWGLPWSRSQGRRKRPGFPRQP